MNDAHRPARFAAFILSLFLASPGWGAPPPEDPTPRIIALSQELMDAITSGEGKVWGRILDDGAIIID